MSRKEVAPAGGDVMEGYSRSAAEALAWRRLYREVMLALRTGLRVAKADLSFLRARGIRSLLGFYSSTASAPDDSPLLLFRHSQSILDLQEFIASTKGRSCCDIGSCI